MEHDPRIGQDFGDYIVTRKLAEGGMGAVYLAEHPSGMRKVVKFMLAECLKVPAIRQRFEKECAAAKRMKGRAGIVDIDSFGVRNGEMYLVMEYLDGVTLETHIRQNVRLTPHHTFHVALQVLRALDALHKEGIIHRDLKPSNVFLRDTDDRPWDVKLIDFGIVHDKQSTTTPEFRTRQGQMIGTPGYMATEQYGRADEVTPATDIFACAVIMWEMLTGELPWGIAPNEFAQHDRQLHHVPVWPTNVAIPHAEGWPTLLMSALAPDPARRPQSAQLFALLLAENLAPIPPHVPSGIQMIEQIHRRFLQNVPPELETIRHANAQQAAAMFWSPIVAGSQPSRSPSSSPSLDAIPVSAVPTPVAPPSVPTVSARPDRSATISVQPSAPASPMTTLSASNGVSVANTAPAARSRLVALGIGTALAVAGVTFGVTRLGSRTSDTSPGDDTTRNVPASQPSSTLGGDQLPPAPPTATTQGGSAAIPGTSTHEVPAEDSNDQGDRTIDKPATETAEATPKAEAAPHTKSPSKATTSTSTRSKKRSITKQSSGTATKPVSTNTELSSTPTSVRAPSSGSGARTGSGTFDPDAVKE